MVAIHCTARLVTCKPGSHITPAYLRRSRRLQLTTVGDLFQWVPGASVMDRRRSRIYVNTNRIGVILTIPPVNMDRIGPVVNAWDMRIRLNRTNLTQAQSVDLLLL